VERVLHPALPEDPGHALWRRDFSGASGLFSVVLKPMPASHLALLLDHLELYGIGASWGGYESLVLPFDANEVRSVTRWPYAGPCFRVHAGLEAAEDLIADMAAGFSRLRAA
jgi:cystathionine beta-lyase